jgi:hypothetical protein
MATWVHFWDMSSGGGQKARFHHYYIESESAEEAEEFFTMLTDRDPHWTTCSCCGPDYSVNECATLMEATAYFRSACYEKLKTGEDAPDTSKWKSGKFIPLADFVADSGHLQTGRDSYLIAFLDKRHLLVAEAVAGTLRRI